MLKSIHKKKIFYFSKLNKNKILQDKLFDLINLHISKNKTLKYFFENINNNLTRKTKLENFPFLPVRLFKYFNLKTITDKNIYKVITSSGTSGMPSKIFLDRKNAKDQIEALYNIGSEYIGKKRLPMIVIDTDKTNFDKYNFNARKAAIIGFSIFASKTYFVLDEELNLKINYLKGILEKHKNEDIIIFGFTSIIWENFVQIINKKKIKLNLKKCIFLHGGGWKKLIDKKISNKKFRDSLNKISKNKKIINYYGMIEQTGSIFFECSYGYFHTSIYTDIFIRDKMLNICKNNQEGVIQLLSIIPTSYPGNIILTEDMGIIFGEDSCKCGKTGKYFKVSGRIPSAELRGCSNVNL